MRVVLDTNVIVSAVISNAGPPDAIVNAWRKGSFQLITSAPLLAEIADVLARPQIRKRSGFSAAEEATYVAALSETAILVEPSERLSVIEDPDDNLLIEAAVAARADFIVTGDKQVLELGAFRDTQIITPARFMAVLAAERRSE
ncbi:MAG: putative toxin-antitoxin system toxin component, PIN family [Dehalococcoidia bacterium]|nr:MAG: putative toxin-antitoxin system toxin component, PIN family [Dehalococcoidia bacterium]